MTVKKIGDCVHFLLQQDTLWFLVKLYYISYTFLVLALDSFWLQRGQNGQTFMKDCGTPVCRDMQRNSEMCVNICLYMWIPRKIGVWGGRLGQGGVQARWWNLSECGSTKWWRVTWSGCKEIEGLQAMAMAGMEQYVVLYNDGGWPR